jgi:hypothetical protein
LLISNGSGETTFAESIGHARQSQQPAVLKLMIVEDLPHQKHATAGKGWVHLRVA